MAKILTSPQLSSTKAAVGMENVVVFPFQCKISLCLCTYGHPGFGVIFILSRQNIYRVMHREVVVHHLIVWHIYISSYQRDE